MASFDVGPISTAGAQVLSAIVLLYAVLVTRYAIVGFRNGLADRWSAAVAAAVMAALGILLWDRGAAILPAPFGLWVLVVVVLGLAITLTYTLGRYQERIDRFRDEFGERLSSLLDQVVPEERQQELRDLRARFSFSPEERRKAPHLLMGIFLVVYLAVGYPLLQSVQALVGPATADGEATHNLFVASNSGWLVAGHVVSVFALLALLFLILPNELLRLKYPELSYPFKNTILLRLRERERGLFGAHYYIVAALPLAALWVASDPAHYSTTVPAVMALIAVTVFGDAASALVGKKWGKAKWFHNTDKSYIGSVGGTLVAFAVAVPFVGVPVGIAMALAFLLVDVVGPVPIPVSDNLLNPLALALTANALRDHVAPLIPFY